MTITGVKIDHFTPPARQRATCITATAKRVPTPGQSQRRMLEVEIDVLDKTTARRHATAHASQQNSSWC